VKRRNGSRNQRGENGDLSKRMWRQYGASYQKANNESVVMAKEIS
jgi:hypothetical protein